MAYMRKNLGVYLITNSTSSNNVTHFLNNLCNLCFKIEIILFLNENQFLLINFWIDQFIDQFLDQFLLMLGEYFRN